MKAADPACALGSRASSRRGVSFRSSFAKADSSSLSEWQAGGFVPIGRVQTDFHVVGFYEGKLKKEVEKHMASKSEFTKSVALTRSRGRAALCLALCMLGLSLSATARDDRKPTIITYDIPGAGTGAGQRTIGGGIIPNGAILGEYVDANNVYHGFVRARDGNITTFDVAGAKGTNASGINPAGAIPGVYFDSNGVNHGYVRNKQGAITTFDVPAAGTGAFQGTLPESINPSGAITGQYLDASGVNHGFLRDKHGVITTFDAPGAGTGAGQGTFPTTNNPSDAITGYYMDANSAFHGFLRIP